MTDIVETAQAADSLRTLLTAVEAAVLTQILRSEGPFTIFLRPLMKLLPVLTYLQLIFCVVDVDDGNTIVVSDDTSYVVVEDITDDDDNATDEVVLVEDDGSYVAVVENVIINEANVMQAVVADNGMIYVIDAVLTPREKLARSQIAQVATTSSAN
jgi:transforming growth factor-beta-induced protein